MSRFAAWRAKHEDALDLGVACSQFLVLPLLIPFAFYLCAQFGWFPSFTEWFWREMMQSRMMPVIMTIACLVFAGLIFLRWPRSAHSKIRRIIGAATIIMALIWGIEAWTLTLTNQALDELFPTFIDRLTCEAGQGIDCL